MASQPLLSKFTAKPTASIEPKATGTVSEDEDVYADIPDLHGRDILDLRLDLPAAECNDPSDFALDFDEFDGGKQTDEQPYLDCGHGQGIDDEVEIPAESYQLQGYLDFSGKAQSSAAPSIVLMAALAACSSSCRISSTCYSTWLIWLLRLTFPTTSLLPGPLPFQNL